MQTSRWGSKAKLEALEMYIADKTIHPGLTEYELLQWKALVDHHGPEGLRGNNYCNLEDLRVAPKPQLPLEVIFSRGKIKKIRAKEGQPPLKFPLAMLKETGQVRLFYQVVRLQTKAVGICTVADLTLMLWPLETTKLPGSNILKILAYRTRKSLPTNEHLKTEWGRGYRLIAGG